MVLSKLKKILRPSSELRTIFTILILTFACYLPALFNQFVNYDDPTLLFENTIIHHFSIQGIFHIFDEILAGHYSRFNPLVFVTYMIVHHLAGFNAFWFHAVNIIFHLATTAVVFLLAKEITNNHRLSFICAVLFGIHPIHVEPVVWISALTHGMYSFFYLFSIYIYSVSQNSKYNKPFLIWVSFFLFAMAGMCFSGGTITLPAVLLLLILFKERNLSPKHAVRLLPFFTLAIYLIYLTIFTAKHADIIDNPYFNTSQESFLARINLSVISLLRYLQQIIFPTSFTFEYPEGYFIPFRSIWITALFLLVLILLVINKGRFFQWKYFSFGFLFFLITITPFLKMYSTSTSITNDRYSYLASFGLFLILAEWIDAILNIKGKTNFIKTILIGGLIYLMMLTWITSLNWRNGEALWSQMIKMYPRAYPSYLGRADYYIKNQDYVKALEDCDMALGYNPAYVEALSLKGEILLRMNSYDQSIKTYSKLLKLKPNNIPALNNRAAAYFLWGKLDLAILDFEESIKLNEDQIDPYLNRATLYIQEKKYDDALKDLQTILHKKPDYQPALNKMEEIKKYKRI